MIDLDVRKQRAERAATAQTIALELKVCEGCGVLWLRAAEQGVYCRRCAESLAEMPVQRPEGRRGRRRKRRGSGPGFQKPALTLVESRGGVR